MLWFCLYFQLEFGVGINATHPPDGYTCEEMTDEAEGIVFDETMQCHQKPERNCYGAYETIFSSHQVYSNYIIITFNI